MAEWIGLQSSGMSWTVVEIEKKNSRTWKSFSNFIFLIIGLWERFDFFGL